MARNRILLITSVLCVSLFAPAFPAHATDSRVIDYCARKSDGNIRTIKKGACLASEYSLGVAPISRGIKRPNALVPKFYSRYLAAKAAAKTHGFEMQITSGYRTLDRQAYLYKKAIERYGSAKEASQWVLPPKKSNHPWGIAIDVNYKVGGTNGMKAAAWLEKNGYKYGLCRRYKNEWWHFEPLVGPGTKCPKMEPYAS